jgi:GNAT superfamily N-acetyltransferase
VTISDSSSPSREDPTLTSLTLSVRGSDVVDALEPLYSELHLVEVEAVGDRLHAPARSVRDAWAIRSKAYRRCLETGGFIIAAEADTTIAGFAIVDVTSGYAGWDVGAGLGEVKDFVVASSWRRRGVGHALLQAIPPRTRRARDLPLATQRDCRQRRRALVLSPGRAENHRGDAYRPSAERNTNVTTRRSARGLIGWASALGEYVQCSLDRAVEHRDEELPLLRPRW